MRFDIFRLLRRNFRLSNSFFFCGDVCEGGQCAKAAAVSMISENRMHVKKNRECRWEAATASEAHHHQV